MDKHEKKRTQIKQQPISGCVHGRGKTKTQNQETNKQSTKKKNHSHTHKSEYGNSMGICQRSLSKTHIKWSNLYPWKLAREHHYQQHIDIHQHDDDRLVQVSALNCPINALIQKKYPVHKNWNKTSKQNKIHVKFKSLNIHLSMRWERCSTVESTLVTFQHRNISQWEFT